jgi:hypothetical protein
MKKRENDAYTDNDKKKKRHRNLEIEQHYPPKKRHEHHTTFKNQGSKPEYFLYMLEFRRLHRIVSNLLSFS